MRTSGTAGDPPQPIDGFLAGAERLISRLGAEVITRPPAHALPRDRVRAAEFDAEVTALRDALRDLAGRLDRAEAALVLPWWRKLFG